MSKISQSKRYAISKGLPYGFELVRDEDMTTPRYRSKIDELGIPGDIVCTSSGGVPIGIVTNPKYIEFSRNSRRHDPNRRVMRFLRGGNYVKTTETIDEF